MSSFLPDTTASGTLTPAATTESLESDIQLARKLLSALAQRPERIPGDFIAQIIDQVQVSNILVPVSQVVGYSQTVPQRASVLTAETTTSLTYTDLATTGPSISGLPDGKYLILVGATLGNNTAGSAAIMSASINGAAADDNSAAIAFAVPSSAITCASVGVAVATLANGGNNTVVSKYRANGGTATFTIRNLIVIRMANL